MNTEPKRKLSPWRALFAILIIVGLAYGTTLGLDHWKKEEAVAVHEPWFAAYVDVTSTPVYLFWWCLE